MLASTYIRRVMALSGLLLVAIIALSFLLYTHGPRVRLVSFELDPQETSLAVGNTATVLFDRPIQDKDYTKQVSITPEIDFDVQTTAQSIVLRFKQNMQSSTQYTIRIEDEIYDRTGRKMSQPYLYSYVTSDPSYAYLERNYGLQDDNTVFALKDADDHVKIGGLSDQPEIVFSHPEIVQFVANGDYVVAVTRSEGENQLHIVDLDTLGTKEVLTLSEGEIRNLTLGARSTNVMYSIVPDTDISNSDYYEQYANTVEAANLETGEVTALKAQDGSVVKAVSIEMDINGQVALVQDLTQIFYAVSPFNDYDPILIGKYTDSFGFNDDSSEIVFRDRDSFARYDIGQATATEQSFGIASYIRAVENTSSGIVYTASRFSADGDVNTVELLDNWEDVESVIVWTDEDSDTQRLNETVIGYDISILALQFSPEECVFDNFGSYSECSSTSTTLYDSDTQSELNTLRGFGLVWLP